MDLVGGFPINSAISSPESDDYSSASHSPSVNSRDIEQYPEKHLGNRSDSISVRSV